MAKANFLGVYSTRGIPGTVSRTSGSQRKHFWFIWHDVPAKTYLAQQLGAEFKPQDKPRLLPPEMFRQAFTHEPKITAQPDIRPDVGDYLDAAFRPARKSSDSVLVTGKIRSGQSGRIPTGVPAGAAAIPGSGGNQAVESAVGGALLAGLELDRNMRAAFAAAIMRFRRGNKDAAVDEFKRLMAVSEGIVPAHKHMFTDFGKDLRRCKLHDLSLTSYSRALELAPDDSHAFFNLARAFYEQGSWREADDYLARALAVEPGLKCASRLQKKVREQIEAGPPKEIKEISL